MSTKKISDYKSCPIAGKRKGNKKEIDQSGCRVLNTKYFRMWDSKFQIVRFVRNIWLSLIIRFEDPPSPKFCALLVF